MSDLKLIDISERIVSAFLEKSYVNKEELVSRVKPILNIWLKKVDKPKRTRVPISKLQETIDSEHFEKTFYKEKMKTLLTADEMQSFWDDLNKAKINEGLH